MKIILSSILCMCIAALSGCAGMVQKNALKEARALPVQMQSPEFVQAWQACFQMSAAAKKESCAEETAIKLRSRLNLYYLNANAQWSLDYWTVNKDAYVKEHLADLIVMDDFPEKNETAVRHFIETAFYEEIVRESNAQNYAYGRAVAFQQSMRGLQDSFNQTATSIRLQRLESRTR